MKELFFYNKPNPEQGIPQVLIIKLSERSCGYAVTNQAGTDLYSLYYCDISDESSLSAFEEKYSALKDTYYEVKIIFDFPYYLLLPFTEETGGDAMSLLNNLHGNNSPSITVTENIPNWQLKNKYAVPADIFDWVRKRFPSAKYLHQYSVSIMNWGAAGDEGKLLVDFSNQQFLVVAGKRNKFLVAKNFEYETPDDVLFYLLKTCEHFSLSPKEVSLELSGLIEKDSALYKELYQYFMNITFRDAGWGSVDDHPAHFFTSFNDIIKCAS